MASGVAIPEVTVPKPTITFAPAGATSTTPEDKVRERQKMCDVPYCNIVILKTWNLFLRCTVKHTLR